MVGSLSVLRLRSSAVDGSERVRLHTLAAVLAAHLLPTDAAATPMPAQTPQSMLDST